MRPSFLDRVDDQRSLGPPWDMPRIINAIIAVHATAKTKNPTLFEPPWV